MIVDPAYSVGVGGRTIWRRPADAVSAVYHGEPPLSFVDVTFSDGRTERTYLCGGVGGGDESDAT